MKLVLPFFLVSVVLAADTGIGCFSQVDTSNFKENGQWETSDSCAKSCGSQYPYVAIKNGGMCYCLSTRPSSNQVSTSQCSTPCNGYGTVNCGGQNAFTVFNGLGEDTGASAGSLALLLSSSSTSTLTSSTVSASTNSPSTSQVAQSTSLDEEPAPTTLSSSTSSSSTHTRVITSTNQDGATKTITQSMRPTSTSSTKASSSASPQLKSSSTNVGAIAGGVVGGVVGLIAICLGVFFFIRHRRNDESDEEEFFEKGSGSGGISRGNGTAKSKKFNSAFDMPMANPFSDEFADKRASKMTTNGLADPRLNPAIVGRKRLSDGSLADETDYSRKILAVANP